MSMTTHFPRHWILLPLALLLLCPPALAKKKAYGELNGRVMNTEQEVLAGVLVKITGSEFTHETKTNRRGEFESRIVDATGEYTVYLEKEGYAPFEATLPVGVGDQQNVDFTLVDEETGKRQRAVEAYNEGANAFNSGDKEKARTLFEEAAALDPQLSQPWLALADIHVEAGRFAEAAEAAEKFLAFEPEDVNGQRLAYEAYTGLGNTEKAEEFRAALGGSDPAKGLAVQTFNEGALATQEGKLEEAVAKFEAALELDPELDQAWVGLMTVHYNLSDYDAAVHAAEKLLESQPDHVQGRRIRYLAYDAGNNRENLYTAFDAYAEVDPAGAADALYQRADLDFRDGNMEVAQEALAKVIAVAPDFARAYYTLGLTYAQSDTAKAREYLEKFIDMSPDDSEVPMAKEMLSHF